MAESSLQSSIRDVLLRLKVQDADRLTDTALLDRYAKTRDEAAFTALVSRHGPAVLNVCSRVSRPADVDDVFQATFLALARQAGSIRRPEAVGAWLYGVAYNTALKARARRSRREEVERAAAPLETARRTEETADRETQLALDEELHRLPDRLRQPLVLIHLLGHIQADAARKLGISDRALRKRLHAGREQLRLRLTGRGVTLTAAALAMALSRQATAGPVPPGLVRPTVKSILAFAAGQAGALPATTISLSTAGMAGMVGGRFKLMGLAVAVPVLAALAFTAYALTPTGPRGSAQTTNRPPVVVLVETPPGRTETVTGRVLDAAGQPVARAAVTALMRRPWQPTGRGLYDQIVARALTDADGQYQMAVPVDFPTWYAGRRVTLVAHAAGLAPATGLVQLGGPPAATDLCLRGGTARQGLLRAADGRPAAGVELAVVRLGRVARELVQDDASPPPPPGWPPNLWTDAEGRFRVDGLADGDDLWLQVQDDRFALSSFSLPAGATEPITVTVSGPRVLTGRVVAEDTGRPVPGARVSVLAGSLLDISDHYTRLAFGPDVSVAGPPVELSGRADDDGRFRLRLPPGREYSAIAYPPDGAAYLRRTSNLVWTEGETERDFTVRLAPGVALTGQVTDEEGRSVAGASVYYVGKGGSTEDPSALVDQVQFRDTATMTGADGQFRLVVPPGPCRIESFGPSADYLRQDDSFLLCPECGVRHIRSYAHARAAVNLKPGARPDPLLLTIRHGTTVTARVVGPDGEPVRAGVAICRCVVHPLRRKVPRPLPIYDGVVELPGCTAGRIYPVLFLDAARKLSAVADLRVPAVAGQSPTTVQLAPCGSAVIRLTDGAGRPVAGQRPLVQFWLGHDRPDGEPPLTDRRLQSLPVFPSWIDPMDYLPGPMTDADGQVVLPTLAAGLEYQVGFRIGSRDVHTAKFRPRPGRVVRLRDMVVDPDGAGGHAGGE
jgi:RNA polymerase sigma factor (sigma-70 family)